MAIFAKVARTDVIVVLAERVCTVMTAKAITRYACMVEIGRQPGDRCMAVIAVIAARNMFRILSERDRAVMAGSASSNDLGVIDGHDRLKESNAVAILANVSRRNMILSFTRSTGSIVATSTIIRNACVVKRCRQPCACRMAIIAVVATGYVRRVFAGRIVSVMAPKAIARNTGMVEICRYPGN